MKTRLKSLAKAALPVVAGIVTFGAACSSHAALVIDENFTGANDTLPDDWSSPGTAAYASIQGNRLRFQRTASGGAAGTGEGQAAYYTGTGLDGSMADGKIADFSASVILRRENTSAFGSTTSAGMVVRDNNTTWSVTAGYYIGVLADNTLGIWTNIGTGPSSNNNVTQAKALDWAAISITANTDYLLEVLAVGSNISASLWAVDGNGAKTGLALGEVSIDDASTAAGYLGLRLAAGNSNQTAYFDNLQVHSIPEPATALLLLPAGALLLYRKRRAARV